MDEMEFLKKLAQCDDKERMSRCIEEFNASKKVITNADRIRAMSNEELAEVIMCLKKIGASVNECLRSTCSECCKYWLQQPAEEES